MKAYRLCDKCECTFEFNTDDIFVHESRDGSKYLAIDCSVCHCIIILGDVQ